MDINKYVKTQWSQMYIASMRPILKKRAVFSDTTENFVTPAEPTAYEKVTIRFRTAKSNVDRVFFYKGK